MKIEKSKVKETFFSLLKTKERNFKKDKESSPFSPSEDRR